MQKLLLRCSWNSVSATVSATVSTVLAFFRGFSWPFQAACNVDSETEITEKVSFLALIQTCLDPQPPPLPLLQQVPLSASFPWHPGGRHKQRYLKPLQDLQEGVNKLSKWVPLAFESLTEPWKGCSCLNQCFAGTQLRREHKSVGAFESVPHRYSAVSQDMHETIHAMQCNKYQQIYTYTNIISTNDSNDIQNWHKPDVSATG